jgi:glycosyltransferase involved in cell wall biosynthesis
MGRLLGRGERLVTVPDRPDDDRPDYHRPVAAPPGLTAPDPEHAPSPARRVPALSYFFPAHNEAENIEGLVAEALEVLPTLAERFEIIAVDDGSRDGTRELADRLAAANPDAVRAVHHTVNQGYGAALRSGFRASRFELVCFTDGDRQFKLRDLGRLLERHEEADHPDVVVGYRLKRADSSIRLAYARAYRLALRLFFGLNVRDVDCACKLFRRAALVGVRLESGGAFLSAELLIKLKERGRTIVEVGIPHYARTAGQASGADPRVVGRAIRDFWRLRVRLWARRSSALKRGEPVLGGP